MEGRIVVPVRKLREKNREGEGFVVRWVEKCLDARDRVCNVQLGLCVLGWCFNLKVGSWLKGEASESDICSREIRRK